MPGGQLGHALFLLKPVPAGLAEPRGDDADRAHVGLAQFFHGGEDLVAREADDAEIGVCGQVGAGLKNRQVANCAACGIDWKDFPPVPCGLQVGDDKVPELGRTTRRPHHGYGAGVKQRFEPVEGNNHANGISCEIF